MNRTIFSAMVRFCKCAAELCVSETNVFCGKVWICTSLSLSFHILYNHSELTIFNFFNFMACEFSVESFRMEIFRVFEGLAMCCILAVYKCIEERLKKDGVFRPSKRRLFSRKRRVSSAKTKSFESKDFVFFRKNGVFSSMVLDFALREVPF